VERCRRRRQRAKGGAEGVIGVGGVVAAGIAQRGHVHRHPHPSAPSPPLGCRRIGRGLLELEGGAKREGAVGPAPPRARRGAPPRCVLMEFSRQLSSHREAYVYLFLLCSEGLTSMLKVWGPQFISIGIRIRAPWISHRLFIDDCLIFTQASDFLPDYRNS
jgi:hypothetical protein